MFILIYIFRSISLFHNIELIRDGELGTCLAAHLLNLDARSQLRQSEFPGFPIDLENTL